MTTTISEFAHGLLTYLYLTCVHGSVTCNHNPGSQGAIHLLQVLFHPFILRRSLCEVMLCAHHHKVDTAIIKTIPIKTYNLPF